MALSKKWNAKLSLRGSFAAAAISSLLILAACGGDSSSSGPTDNGSSEVVAVKDKSISGVSQKGPFVTGSAVTLYELDGKTYASTGKSFPGKIASDDGKFSVSSVNLASQYALLKADGYFRNEITGEKSSGTITLNALTDLSDREKVNINLLTHLEYERALYLVGTGISVSSAKKLAEAEILNAFGIKGEFASSEDLDIFSKGDGNAALLAFSVLMLSDLSEADLTELLTKFAIDIEKDGSWDDESTKAKIADWAAAKDIAGGLASIRSNIEKWNFGTVPEFEKYVRSFWYTNYGLSECGSSNKAEVLAAKNELSSKYGKQTRFICKDGIWVKATDIEKDTYKWVAGKDGEIKAGNVTNKVYVFDKTVWRTANNVESKLGGCVSAIADSIGNVSSTYFICKSNEWIEATDIEKDTYKWESGEDGEIKTGDVTQAKKYDYDAKLKKWRDATMVEAALGGCTEAREADFSLNTGKVNGTWYICKNRVWESTNNITVDTQGWIKGSDGDLQKGSSTDVFYKYDNAQDKWLAATHNDTTLKLMGCTINRTGEIGKSSSDDTYYVCKNMDWQEAQEIDYDTYGEKCTSAEVGKTISGMVTATNKYYCSANGWVSLTSGWRWDVPKEVRLNPEITYGIMIDSRDNKIYKTVKIGDQVWMAENLNYADSIMTPSLNRRSWCYDDKVENCAVAGRLYTWAAAIDSVKLYDGGNGMDCGYFKACMLPEKVQGICPPGWHLPTNTEWELLFVEVGGISTAGMMLKSQTGWNNGGNGIDAFGFSAIPAGRRSNIMDVVGYFISGGDGVFFRSASESGIIEVSCMHMGYDLDEVYLENGDSKISGYSVRCLKD